MFSLVQVQSKWPICKKQGLPAGACHWNYTINKGWILFIKLMVPLSCVYMLWQKKKKKKEEWTQDKNNAKSYVQHMDTN